MIFDRLVADVSELQVTREYRDSLTFFVIHSFIHSSNRPTIQRLTPGKVYETRASKLRAHQFPVDSAPLWQLRKFDKKVCCCGNAFLL